MKQKCRIDLCFCVRSEPFHRWWAIPWLDPLAISDLIQLFWSGKQRQVHSRAPIWFGEKMCGALLLSKCGGGLNPATLPVLSAAQASSNLTHLFALKRGGPMKDLFLRRKQAFRKECPGYCAIYPNLITLSYSRLLSAFLAYQYSQSFARFPWKS